jgi:endonuclease V-like protein UPF0215 family
MSETTEVINVDYINNKSSEEVNELIDGLIDLIKGDFAYKDEVVTLQLGKKTKEIKVNDLILSLLLIRTRFSFKRKLTFDDFVNVTGDVNGTILKYFNESIITYDGEDRISLTDAMANTAKELARYAWQINYLKGNSINIYDMVHLAKDYPEVKKLLEFESNENSQFSEIERTVEEQAKKLIEILKASDTCYKNLLSSVSLKQFQQVFVNISLKPDLYGRIIEKPINTSFYRGLRNSTDYFTNALGARKALIINATQVRSAGYLSRKLALLLINTTLARDEEDCGSEEYTSLEIKDKDIAKRVLHRFYFEEGDEGFSDSGPDGNYLIGKTIHMRGPIGCSLTGNKICKACYGGLADMNDYHIGMAAVLLLTEQITQMLLSSKHLLAVKTDKIELPVGMEDFFDIDKNSLIAKDGFTISIDEFVTDEESNTKTVGKLTVHSEEEAYEFSIEDIELFADNIENRLDEENRVDIRKGEEVFRMSIENNEISAPLKKLLKLLESEEELNKRESTDELVADIIDLLNKSNIRSSSVGVEMIVRELARDPENIQRRHAQGTRPYFLKLTNAIINSNSVAVSLAFERLRQLLETNLFDKTEESIIDGIF